MTEHTPGPWKQFINDKGELWIECGSHNALFVGDVEDTCGECHANARLIAATPDLLAACESFLQAFDGPGPNRNRIIEAMKMAELAIIKAKPIPFE